MNNKGLSLIELVIAIAISSIILGAAFSFITSAEKAYHTAEYGIDLQMEGQILMEQIGNWVLESNRIVVTKDKKVLLLYYIPMDNGKTLAADYYPTGYSPDNTAKCRVIFQPNEYDEDGNLTTEGKKLYMKTITGISNAEEHIKNALNAENGIAYYSVTTDAVDENCIGAFVEDFILSYSSGEDAQKLNSVNITLISEEVSKGYTIADSFCMRNGMFNKFTSTPEPEETTESTESTESTEG